MAASNSLICALLILDAIFCRAQSTEELCGGIIEASSGLITSPGFPGPYPPNVSCVWDIHAPTRSSITLIFNQLDLDSETRGCPNGDYVHVWGELNGQSFARNKVICGNISQALTLRNVDNRMRVLFKSDSQGERNGFSASFTSVDETKCGRDLEGSSGEITSPGYPNYYPPNKRCVWDITAPAGHKITLTFSDFDLENRTSTCPDKVVIWSRLMGRQFRRQVKYCGQDLPASFRSQDNRLRVEFKSDSSIEGRGFSAAFYSDNREVDAVCNEHQFQCNQTLHCIPAAWRCDGYEDCGDSTDEAECRQPGTAKSARRRIHKCRNNVTSLSGTIVSPLYRPSKETEGSHGIDCSWSFGTQPGHRLQLDFQDLSLTEHPDIDQDCVSDRLTIHEGFSRSAPVSDHFCGLQELPLTITSRENRLLLTYRALSNTFWNGFNLTHRIVCGGRYEARTSEAKLIVSHPEFGKAPYPANMSCQWSFHASPGRKIELNFTTFEVCQNETDNECADRSQSEAASCNRDDTESDSCEDESTEQEPNCSGDVVEVTEDRNSFQVPIAKLCGRRIPRQIVSTENNLNVLLVTNDVAGAKGFSATYRAIEAPALTH